MTLQRRRSWKRCTLEVVEWNKTIGVHGGHLLWGMMPVTVIYDQRLIQKLLPAIKGIFVRSPRKDPKKTSSALAVESQNGIDIKPSHLTHRLLYHRGERCPRNVCDREMQFSIPAHVDIVNFAFVFTPYGSITIISESVPRRHQDTANVLVLFCDELSSKKGG